MQQKSSRQNWAECASPCPRRDPPQDQLDLGRGHVLRQHLAVSTDLFLGVIAVLNVVYGMIFLERGLQGSRLPCRPEESLWCQANAASQQFQAGRAFLMLAPCGILPRQASMLMPCTFDAQEKQLRMQAHCAFAVPACNGRCMRAHGCTACRLHHSRMRP